MAHFTYAPPSDPIEILHHDDHLLIVNKPAGLLSVPGKAIEHADCLETRVKAQVSGALLIHRLDMDTSGVMVFAMNKAAQRHIGLQFEKRYTSKTYVAVVGGVMVNDTGTVDLPLIVDWPNRPLQMVCHERGKPATTHWRVLERQAQTTRVELRPITGRSHQLRVHMLALGHPIVGDRFYGPNDGAERMMLHSQTLNLRHPSNGDEVSFTAKADF